MRRPALLLACILASSTFGAFAAPLPTAADLAAAAADVKAAEIAFARTMADRKLDQFAGFVAEDAVFVGTTTRIGRADVVQGWTPFFAKPAAPFSWAPDAVVVAADGHSAVSTGLARDANGAVIGRFTSLWRKEADGRWRVAADQGVDANCAGPAQKK